MVRHLTLEQPIFHTIPDSHAAVSRKRILGVEDQLRHRGIDSPKEDMTM
jgi:hypothetical protein